MVDEQQKAERHQARQQRLKEKVDARIAAAQEERGLLIVITGDGKGKSTSGFGTVCRAVGHGLKPAVAQFIKGTWACGERSLLEGSGVPFAVMATGFTWETQDKAKDTEAALTVWQTAKGWLTDPTIDLVLLDELTYMLAYGYLDLDEVLRITSYNVCYTKLLRSRDPASSAPCAAGRPPCLSSPAHSPPGPGSHRPVERAVP